MTEHCLRPEEMARLAQEPPDGPLHLHLAACARCRALFAAYHSFLEPETLPDLDLREVEAELGAYVRSKILRAPDGLAGEERELPATGPRRIEGAAPRSRGGEGLRRLFGGFLRPLPLAGLAGAAAVVLLFLLTPDPLDRFRPRSGATRSAHPAAGAAFLPLPPEPAAQGALRLRWTRASGADRYLVALVDPGLKEIARLPVSDTTFVLDRSVVPGTRAAGGGIVLWQIIALRDGDEIAHTALQALP